MTKKAEIRLGYACINETLKKKSVSVNRSCIQRTREANTVKWLFNEKILPNLRDVLKICKWNEAHGIRLYRMSSDMFPHFTNPKTERYTLEKAKPILEKIGRYARRHGHRLTFHPGQFTQLGSPNEQVFEKSVADLKMHADIMEAMGLDKHSVIVLHGGGVYTRTKNYTFEQYQEYKQVALNRIKKRFPTIPKYIRNRIVFENCEKCYSVTDLLPLCQELNVPLVLDTHHHYCYERYYEPRRAITNTNYIPQPQKPLKKLIPHILATWDRRGIRPKFHISDSKNNTSYDPDDRIEPNSHHEYVNRIPKELRNIHKFGCCQLDIMVEAKAKELAVLRLM